MQEIATFYFLFMKDYKEMYMVIQGILFFTIKQNNFNTLGFKVVTLLIAFVLFFLSGCFVVLMLIKLLADLD